MGGDGESRVYERHSEFLASFAGIVMPRDYRGALPKTQRRASSTEGLPYTSKRIFTVRHKLASWGGILLRGKPRRSD